ncbi:MAG: hypothetical protein MJZ72_07420 [Bacteroidales bacterium]|nr:hypothetical protein [Bacteroidales bacterium]
MIKVHYGDKEKLKAEYISIFNLEDLKSKWDEIRKKFSKAYPKLSGCFPIQIRDLLIMDFESLVGVYEKYTQTISPECAKICGLHKDLESILSYDSYANKIAEFFINHANDMQIHTCHYCDMAYINVYYDGENGKEKRQFDIDHVLDKGRCPLVALSLFNFVFSCQVCNSRIKGQKQVTEVLRPIEKLSPTSEKYDFDNNVTICINPQESNCSTVGFENRMNDYMLNFDTHLDRDYDNVISFFKLKERYDFHKCEALRLLDLKERYTDTKIREMSRMIIGDNNSNVSSNCIGAFYRIKEDIFADDFMQKHHRALGKLHKDIMERN